MILIVSGGRKPNWSFLKSYIDRANKIVAADSGSEILLEHNIKIDLLVGDFDSISDHTKNILIDNIEISDNKNNIKRYKTQKDFTDSEAALRETIKYYDDDEIILLAAIGTRMDHTLSNFGLFEIAKNNNKKLEIVDENNIIKLLTKSTSIKKERNFISFSAYRSEVKNFSLSGFKYNLENYTLKQFDLLNVSNELVSKYGKVSFEEGGEVLIIHSND